MPLYEARTCAKCGRTFTTSGGTASFCGVCKRGLIARGAMNKAAWAQLEHRDKTVANGQHSGYPPAVVISTHDICPITHYCKRCHYSKLVIVLEGLVCRFVPQVAPLPVSVPQAPEPAPQAIYQAPAFISPAPEDKYIAEYPSDWTVWLAARIWVFWLKPLWASFRYWSF